MFDIAFSELMVVALVALIVIGPERLPGLARKAGEWWGRTQRYVNKVKQDIAHDMAVEEATKLQHDIEKHIAEAEQAMQENGPVVLSYTLAPPQASQTPQDGQTKESPGPSGLSISGFPQWLAGRPAVGPPQGVTMPVSELANRAAMLAKAFLSRHAGEEAP